MSTWRSVFILFIAGLFAGPAVAQSSRCSLSPFQTREGQTATMTMRVKGGGSCAVRLGSSLAAIREARVLSAPSVGVAAAQGTTMTYRAKQGYAGPDRFTWAWIGMNRWGKESTWAIAVAVTVVP